MKYPKKVMKKEKKGMSIELNLVEVWGRDRRKKKNRLHSA